MHAFIPQLTVLRGDSYECVLMYLLAVTNAFCVHRCIGRNRWGQWCGCPWQQSPLGSEMNIFYSLHPTNFKLLRQRKQNNCNFLKFIIYIRSGHCCYWLWEPKTQAIPLCVQERGGELVKLIFFGGGYFVPCPDSFGRQT
jgi:hypothetical protein